MNDDIEDDHLVQLNPDSLTYCKYERNEANTACVAKLDNKSDCTPPDVFPSNADCSDRKSLAQVSSTHKLKSKDGETPAQTVVYCAYTRNTETNTCVANTDVPNCTPWTSLQQTK